MTFRIHDLDTAPAASKEPLGRIAEKYGFIPNLAGVFAESPGALKGLLGAIDAFDADDMSLTAIERQVILLAVSARNRCEYCTAAHSMLATMAGLDRTEVNRLWQGNPLSNPRLEALRRFTEAVVDQRGWVKHEDLESFGAGGFGKAQMLEVVFGVALKTFTNYANHIANPPVNEPLVAFLPEWDAVA